MESYYLNKVKTDFDKIKDKLHKIAVNINNTQGYDKPIFMISFDELKTPFPIVINKNECNNNEAYYYACYFNALVSNGIIKEDQLFKESYKDPKEYCCLLHVHLSRNEFEFIYIPYEDKK